MILLNPKQHDRHYPDARSREIMRKTIDFFERKGKRQLKHDDRERVWYADFLAFVKREKIFATLLTPAGYGDADARWDTWRICEFNEILGFYGLAYRYTWQVSILGLGPIWMSKNDALKRKAAQLLREGAIFGRPVRESPRRRSVLHRDATGAARRGRLHRRRTQVLHRQRQPGGHDLHLRQARRFRSVRVLRGRLAASAVRVHPERV
jgi:acyl-CoA dehydrogenase